MMFGEGVRKWMRWGMMLGIGRGQFQFLVLLALEEKPMHGYALIQELSRTYRRPVSAGIIYPTLQELEDQGYIKSRAKEGKKVYVITAQGKKHLEENQDVVDRLRTGREYADRISGFAFMDDLLDIHQLIMMNLKDIDEEKSTKLQEVIADAKKRVAAVVFQ